MTAHEKHMYFSEFSDIILNPLADFLQTETVTAKSDAFDPELLYVECHACGKPVLWEKGKTTDLLVAAGVNMNALDERCLIVSEGCPLCAPLEKDGYTLAVVRIAGLTPEEAAYMSRPAGTS